jgi:hypothetical protein
MTRSRTWCSAICAASGTARWARICAATGGRRTSTGSRSGSVRGVRCRLHRCRSGTPRSPERYSIVTRACGPGPAAGVERARSGELPAAGTAVMSRALARAQLLELRRRQGRELGRRRAEAFRARRELRATELGYRDLATYLRQRYTADGARVEDLARELDVALSAVVAEMDRAGIPRRPRGDGLRADTRQRRARLAAR